MDILHRIDCVTDTHAVEVESVLKWQEGISQALRYGEASNKRPLLVLVVETQEQLSILRQAIDTIRRNNLKLEVEKLENFSSLEDSLAQIPGKTVKMSSSKICHVKNCGHYSATKFPIAEFDTLAECLNGGGHKADNIGEETLWACERNANNGRDSRSQMKLARTSEFFVNSAYAESLENEDSQQSFCSKICSKGKACGNSCISRDKQCHKPKGSACDSM
ncbi:MAG: hypothetical protein K2P98_06705 [Neisseriaceae bacterium]|nr:hypothetical protein [Neisseriaceae bacterium]